MPNVYNFNNFFVNLFSRRKYSDGDSQGTVFLELPSCLEKKLK